MVGDPGYTSLVQRREGGRNAVCGYRCSDNPSPSHYRPVQVYAYSNPARSLKRNPPRFGNPSETKFREVLRERVSHWQITRAILWFIRLVTRNWFCQWMITLGSKWRLIPGPVLSRLRVVGRHQLQSPGGTSFVYIATSVDELAPNVIWRRGWETTSLKVFSEICQESSRILDVGAYSGIYSLVAATDNPSVEIVAVEPNPRILPTLKKNVSANRFDDRIQIVEAAASDSEGRGVLHLNDDSLQSSLERGFGTTPQTEEVGVQLRTLDSIVNDYGLVDLVKIDVEGAELRVLRGSTSLIERARPTFILELLNVRAFESAMTWLGEHGYESPIHLGAFEATRAERWQGDPVYCNYLFSSS